MDCTKGAFFFQKVGFIFKSPNLPKKFFQKTILSLKFEIPVHISKQLIQISSSAFWNNFLGRLGDLKNESNLKFMFSKKASKIEVIFTVVLTFTK